MHPKREFPYRSRKRLRVFLLLLIPLFLLISNNHAVALKFTNYFAEEQSIVKTSPITLSSGNSSECSFSSTYDYAHVTTTAGLRFIENTNLLIPTQAVSPSIDGSNIAQFTSATIGSCAVSTTAANDVIYVAISILGTTATSSVTNSSGSLLTPRTAVTNVDGVRCETWYQIAPNTGIQNITVSFNTATTFAIIVFGIKNANMPNPFDLTSGNPTTGIGTGSTQAVTVGTVMSNALVLGSVAVAGSYTPTIVAGFTRVQRGNSGGLGEAVECKSLKAVDYTLVYTTTGINSVRWAMIGDAIWGKLPSLSEDTGFSEPSSGGSTILSDAKEGYLVSPAYPRTTTINAGAWQLNLWVESQVAGEELQLMLLVTDSSYNVLNDVCSRKGTGPISDVLSLVAVDCEQPQVIVPAGGHLVIIVSNIAGPTPFTIYWGTQGLTNFITTRNANYILQANNLASTSYNIDFQVSSSANITRLTNLTLYAYAPISNCITVTNGAFTQTSSPTLSVTGTSTLTIALNATATDFYSSSNLVILLRFSPDTKPFAYNVINLTIN